MDKSRAAEGLTLALQMEVLCASVYTAVAIVCCYTGKPCWEGMQLESEPKPLTQFEFNRMLCIY